MPTGTRKNDAGCPSPYALQMISEMSNSDQTDLKTNIVNQITAAFEMEDDSNMESVVQLAANIIATITTALKAKPPLLESKSKIASSDAKRKGNAYSHFVGVVGQQQRGEEKWSSVMVTAVKRDKISDKTGKNIDDHAADITYDKLTSFQDFFTMINCFETQTMKRSAIMWNLLSDADRLQFAE